MDENEMGLAVEKDHYDPKIFGCPQYQLSVREEFKDTIKNQSKLKVCRRVNALAIAKKFTLF